MGTSEVELTAFLHYVWLQGYGGQGVRCGGLNENDLYRLMCVNAQSPGSGAVLNDQRDQEVWPCWMMCVNGGGF